MGRVDDMARLCGQVRAGHQNRRELVVNLAKGNAELKLEVQVARAANRAVNKERGRRILANLAAFMAVLAGHEKVRQQAAARSRKSRTEFVNRLARSVAATRKAHRSESAASIAAWRGVVVVAKPSGKRNAVVAS